VTNKKIKKEVVKRFLIYKKQCSVEINTNTLKIDINDCLVGH
jgi:hypothetical protein